MTATAPEVIDHADVDAVEATADALGASTEADVVDAATPVATLVDLDPRALAANPANVRTNLGDLGPLSASIAAVGVLEVLSALPTNNQRWVA